MRTRSYAPVLFKRMCCNKKLYCLRWMARTVFVCLLATLKRIAWTHVHENFSWGRTWHKEKSETYWGCRGSPPECTIFSVRIVCVSNNMQRRKMDFYAVCWTSPKCLLIRILITHQQVAVIECMRIAYIQLETDTGHCKIRRRLRSVCMIS